MPRGFDSDDRGAAPTFVENVDCPECGTVFEGLFRDFEGSMSVEDMTDPPIGFHVCPHCQRAWKSEATGWSFFSEAG